MFKNKNTLMIIVSAVIVLVLGFCVVFQFSAIKEVKTSNIDSQNEIDKLIGHIDSLNSALKDASNDAQKNKTELAKYEKELEDYEKELKKYKEEIQKHQNELDQYQKILTAWNNGSLEVREAIETITNAYVVVAENSHLYPAAALEGFEDKMMDTIYCAIRSATPLSWANDFVNTVEALNPVRFDVILKGKIESVKADGVLFPEDNAGYEDAYLYYNSFINNPSVLETFAEQNLDKELAEIFAMLDADEESDLAKIFVDEVNAVDLPVTVQTSLKTAMHAWDNLQNALEEDDVLDDETLAARALLDSYIARIEELACPPHNCADCIRLKLGELLSIADEATKQFLYDVAREIEALLDCFNLEEANRCLENVISDLCPCPHT
jgi:hypothetical protein